MLRFESLKLETFGKFHAIIVFLINRVRVKYVPLFVIVIILATTAKSQNLVPNGSFEDRRNCETIGAICPPAGWLYIKRKSTNGNVRMPDGIQAIDGDAKLCVVVASKKDEKRCYWETTLLHTLEKNKRYTLTIQLHGWGESPNLNDLGIWFVDSLFFSDEDTLLQPKDYVDILHAKVKPEKNGWFRIEREIIPDHDVRYILLGNFSPKDYQKIAQTRYTDSYYVCDFVDDIRIEPVIKEPCAECPNLRDSIYMASLQEFKKQWASHEKDTTSKIVKRVVDTVELPNVLFAFNSSTFVDSSRLLDCKKIFESTGIYKIVIAGYTDSIGSKEYNAILAQKRAEEVAKQIERQFRISPAMVQTVGVGVSTKYKEMDSNRRVEIYVYRK